MAEKDELGELSRAFLRSCRVYRYRMKKIADMTDGEAIRACHWYCHENQLTNGTDGEWERFCRQWEKNAAGLVTEENG